MFWTSVPLLLLTALASLRAAHIVDWVRAAWILRRLQRPPGNIVFSGVKRLLTGKRLRVMQKLNESLVAGSGVFYYNILWGHVRVPVILMSDIAAVTQSLYHPDTKYENQQDSQRCSLPTSALFADGCGIRATSCGPVAAQWRPSQAYTASYGTLPPGQMLTADSLAAHHK